MLNCHIFQGFKDIHPVQVNTGQAVFFAASVQKSLPRIIAGLPTTVNTHTGKLFFMCSSTLTNVYVQQMSDNDECIANSTTMIVGSLTVVPGRLFRMNPYRLLPLIW